MTRLHKFFARMTVAAVLQFAVGGALAQVQQSLALVRVMYTTQKNTVKPQGALKEKIDALDREIADTARSGDEAQIRRLYAKGMALLAGGEWTGALDYRNSLVLRTDRVIADSTKPLQLRLEQTYSPDFVPDDPLIARVTLHQPAAGAGQLGAKIRDIATLEGVPKGLKSAPFKFNCDLAGVADGRAVLRVEMQAKGQSLGAVQLPVDLVSGLDERMRKIEDGWSRIHGFDGFRGDVLYPIDYIRNVNSSRIAAGTFNAGSELKNAEANLAMLTSGKDPFAGKTGDFKRHYFFEDAGEVMPYRLYVPTTYDGTKAFPLIIALHGLGGTEDSFFAGYEMLFPKLAEQRGYIVAAPLGFRVDGFYGYGSNPSAKLSEKDVMNVLALMRKNYNIDSNRIYLAGHSMGGIGTWYLGVQFPEIWAAIAPFSGLGDAKSVERMKNIPEFIVHGDADPTVNVQSSRTMVAEMKRLGVEYQYIEVPGGSHSSVVAPNFKGAFDFFDAHRKK
jgi:predicted esterase